MPIRAFTIVLLFLGLTSPLTAEVEVTPMVGYRTGSAELITGIVCIASIGAPCPSVAESEDGTGVSLVVDIALDDNWMFELLLSRHSSDLGANFTPCIACLEIFPFFNQELELTSYHIGVQRRWRVGKVQPFAAVGAGLTEVSTSSGTFGFLRVDEEGPSVSLAAGIKVPLGSFLGLRFEARGYWIDLPHEVFVDDLVQTELAGGLTFRW